MSLDTSDIIKVVHTRTDELYRVAEYLDNTASAFSMTGNSKMFNMLHQQAARILAAADAINTALHLRLDHEYAQAQQASSTLLEGVLAGIELGKESGKEVT